MEKRIAVLDADNRSCNALGGILESHGFPTTSIHSLAVLESLIQSGDILAVVVDIDSVPVDNRTIRELTLKYPGVRFLCTSKDRFHPELKDAICYHIYACLNKPVDPDELLYWIKSVRSLNKDITMHLGL